jgi:hypothetical protein
MPANLLELRHFPNPRPALSESADLAGSQQGFEARRDDNRPIGDPAYKDTPPNEAAATRVGIDLGCLQPIPSLRAMMTFMISLVPA